MQRYKGMIVSTSHRYRSDIDGLRALAILLVVLYHSGVTLFSGGFIGVDIFFVISGFLIGGIISKEFHNSTFSYYNFYARRIKRIAPALLTMLLLCSIFSYYFLSPLELIDFAKYSVATILSVPNIALWKGMDYFSTNSDLNPLLMTWSLGVEEQFYIFLPLIFSLCIARRIKLFTATIFITIVSFLLCLYITNIKPSPAFYLLPTRAWEMGVGVAIALKQNEIYNIGFIKKNKPLCFLIGTILVLSCSIFLDNNTLFPGFIAVLPVLGASLIIIGESRASNVFLSNKPMVYIGIVSYSWYLWHWPFLSFTRMAYNGHPPVTITLFVSTLALILSYFSYKLVEVPFRKPMKASNKKIVLIYISTVSIFITPLILSMLFGGLKYRVNNEIIVSEKNRLISISDKCLVANTQSLPDSSDCIPNKDSESVALVGDSHAAALRGGVDIYAKNNNMSVYQLTKSSCPFLVDTPRYIKRIPEHAELCNNFNKNVIKELIDNKKIKVVIMSAYWDAGISLNDTEFGYHEYKNQNSDNNITALQKGLSKTIEILRNNGKKIIIVEDVPYFKFDVVKEVINKNIPLRYRFGELIGNPPESSQFSPKTIAKMADVKSTIESMKTHGAIIFSPEKNLCNLNGCQYSMNGISIYYDQQHLNMLGGGIALKGLN
ncbi:acyltransferase [Rahnella aquatilis]|nr:acyltransferase [Rahnella aquatilis]